MKFKEKNKIIIFCLLIVLNLAMRIPVILHEVGLDTYYIHFLGNIMTLRGYPAWIQHPLQFFGFSSQPPSVPILISLLSQTSPLSSEITILLISVITAIIAIFCCYTFIYYFTEDDLSSFFGTFIFSIAPEFLRMTSWTITTRAMFVALMPLLIYLLFKSARQKSAIYFCMLFTLLLFLFSTHHLGFYIVLIFVAFFMVLLLKFAEINVSIRSKKLNPGVIWFLCFILLVVAIVARIGPISDHPSLWITYTSGFFFEGESISTLFLNMVTDYGGKVGILLPFAAVGLFVLFSKRERSIYENALLLSLLMFTPLLGIGVYTPVFLLPILSLFIAIGLKKALGIEYVARRSKIAIVFIILISISFSMFMMVHWGFKSLNDDADVYMGRTKNTASFLNEYGAEGSFTSNERGGNIFKYSVYSGMLPAPGSQFENRVYLKPKLSDNWENMLAGSLEEIIVFETIRTETKDVSRQRNSVSSSGWQRSSIWYQFPALWSSGLEEKTAQEMITYYDIKYVLETNFGGYSVYYVKNMKFFKDVNAQQPRIYDNGQEEIYSL